MEGGAGREDSDPYHFIPAVPGAMCPKPATISPMLPTLSESLGLSRQDQQPEHLLKDTCLLSTNIAWPHGTPAPLPLQCQRSQMYTTYREAEE